MVTKTKDKEFIYTVVLIDGNSFSGEPMSESKARDAASEAISDGCSNGDLYYPANQIKRVKVSEHV